jgi:hypothetical protein
VAWRLRATVDDQARAFVDAVCPLKAVEAINGKPQGTFAVAIVNRAGEVMVAYSWEAAGESYLMAFSPVGIA